MGWLVGTLVGLIYCFVNDGKVFLFSHVVASFDIFNCVHASDFEPKNRLALSNELS